MKFYIFHLWKCLPMDRYLPMLVSVHEHRIFNWAYLSLERHLYNSITFFSWCLCFSRLITFNWRLCGNSLVAVKWILKCGSFHISLGNFKAWNLTFLWDLHQGLKTAGGAAVWTQIIQIPPGGGHGNPFQYSRMENPKDRGGWRATVCGVPKGQTRLKRLSMHSLLMCVGLELWLCVSTFDHMLILAVISGMLVFAEMTLP